MPVKYPEEFQLKVVHRYESGASIPDLCQEFHLATSTVYRWIKVHRTIQTPQRTYTPAEFDALSRRLKKWSMNWKSFDWLTISIRFH